MSTSAVPMMLVIRGLDVADQFLFDALTGYERLGEVDLREVVTDSGASAAFAKKVNGDFEAHAGDNDGVDRLLEEIRYAAPASLRLLLTSGLTDAARLLTEEPDLCRIVLHSVTILRGTSFDEEHRRWAPDAANESAPDRSAAEAVFRVLQAPGWERVGVNVVTPQAADFASPPPGVRINDAVEAAGRPLHSVIAAVAAVEPHYFLWVDRAWQRHVWLISGVPNPAALKGRIRKLLRLGTPRQ